MFKQILSISLFAVLLAVPSFAKDVQKLNLTGNIECGGCKNKIEKALNKTDGIEKCDVDLKKQSIKVTFDKDVISQDEVIAVVNKAETNVNATVADTKADKADKSAKKEAKAKHTECDKPCHEAQMKK